MWAMLVTVDIEQDRTDESEKMLREVTIPGAKAQEGFVRGMWLRSADRTKGRGVVVFDSEEQAKATVAMLTDQGPPPEAPVKIRSVDVFEIIAEA